MKSSLVLLCAATCAGAAQAQGGYAFDNPGLLATQRTWGIAHGARLLAQACARAGHGAAAEAWVDWQEREMSVILGMRRELSEHYFGRPTASGEAVAAALGLRQSLALPRDELDPACASFPAALAQPRYDLGQRRTEMMRP